MTLYCPDTIESGRFTGFHCGNALPCRIHTYDEAEVKAIADNLQSRGPDEYPRGYYEHMAETLFRAGIRTRSEVFENEA